MMDKELIIALLAERVSKGKMKITQVPKAHTTDVKSRIAKIKADKKEIDSEV